MNKYYFIGKNSLNVQEVCLELKNVEKNLEDNEFKGRYSEIFRKNPDFEFLKNFNLYKCSKEDGIFYFCPLTTAATERSFSLQKKIL